MELVSIYKQENIDFLSLSIKKQQEFTMEHFGLSDVSSLTDDQVKNLIADIDHWQSHAVMDATRDLDDSDILKGIGRPFNEDTLIALGLADYVSEYYHARNKTKPKDPDRDRINMIYDSYPAIIEYVMTNDNHVIEHIEDVEPMFQKAYLGALESGLMCRKEMLTESEFHETHKRAIKLYRKICNDHGHEMML